MTSRKRFTEREVIATLLHQGVEIRCYRTKELVTLENYKDLQREHLHERALDGPDVPGNCRYSLKAAHAIVTDGTKATSAGSSKHRIAKTKEPRTSRYVVHKREPGSPKPITKWTGRRFPASQRKLQSRPFGRKATTARIT